MKDGLVEANRYLCRYCGRSFATRRHKCQFSPGSCFSCIHLSRSEGTVDIEKNNNKNLICDIDRKSIPMDELKRNKWILTCSKFELIPDYSSKASFLAHIRKKKRIRKSEKS